jgi:ABC-type Fe3+ transport system substrate-binding protein
MMHAFQTHLRRCALAAAGVVALCAQPAAQARAETLDDLAAKAAKGGEVVWYESSPEDLIDKVIEAFNQHYPKVKIKFVRVVGGNALASRSVQEMEARGYTADVLTGGADHIWQLSERNILHRMDWSEIGIPKKLTPTDFAVATAASIYVLLWNTNKVKDGDVPKTWDEVLDPKWTGRIGTWVRASAFAQLASVWGADKAEAALKELIALKPFLFKSTFPMAQQVAAGEVDIALGFYHTAQPPIKAGAPLKLHALDPVPMHTIYTGITRTARNLAGAKLLVAWLSTPEGAKAYEGATSRGNHLLEGTKAAALLKGKKAAEWPPEKTDRLGELNEKYNKMLASVGQAR